MMEACTVAGHEEGNIIEVMSVKKISIWHGLNLIGVEIGSLDFSFLLLCFTMLLSIVFLFLKKEDQ